jgi:hypothetical protein
LIGGNGDGSIDALAEGTIGFTVDANDPEELLSTIAKALSGNRRDPAQVQRFKFANFAQGVADLTSAHLLGRQGDPCGDELLCRDSPATTPAQDCIE